MKRKRKIDSGRNDGSIFDLADQLANQKKDLIFEKMTQNDAGVSAELAMRLTHGENSDQSQPLFFPQQAPETAVFKGGTTIASFEEFDASFQPEIPAFPRIDENGELLVGSSIVIGKRSSQQDALAMSQPLVYNKFTEPWLGVLCDGMGGMNGGERASLLAVNETIAKFREVQSFPDLDIPLFYQNVIHSIDYDVSSLDDGNGRFLGAGTTFISIMIKDGNLFWASVGDSHIYIIRNNQIMMVVKEHNYLQDLLALANKGEITYEEAYADKSKGALTSYIGIGGVTQMDISNAFRLQPGDIAVLCSDGLYRTLGDDEIHSIVLHYSSNMQAAADALTNYTMLKNNPYQDNTAVILVKYK